MSVINTLFELLNQYKVEIPIVQRDYAQGRSDKHSTSVRENLLNDIKDAVTGKGVLDLNFIYGKTENGKFIPLDGQQRLTTLFLVHLYAFANDETKTELLKNFSYETRVSSRNFLVKLVECRASIFASNLTPSEEISESDWYQPDWDNDPTVQSVKKVLDDIADTLNKIDDLSGKLSNPNNEPVQFSFLPMDELGMEDSIYIKLNARGRMLTPFENYKAQLISRVQRLWEDKKLRIEPHDFERCLDGKWTDLFWSSRRNDFDSAFKNFFNVLFSNIANSIENSSYVGLVEIKDVTPQMVESAYFTLNYFCTNDRSNEAWRIIIDCLGGSSSFSQREMFFSVSEYILQAKGNVTQSLSQWIRIIRNIINNTNEQAIGRAENFGTALQAIKTLTPYWNDLVNFFAKEIVSLKIFSPTQIEEERIKANLILRGDDYADTILTAEKHGYFCGQLRSALTLAGIDYDIAKGEGESYLKDKMCDFGSYWNKITALFNDKGAVYGNLMRQALLSLKDYTIQTGSYYSFGVDNPNDPVSLKALFADVTQKDLVRTVLNSFSTTRADDIKTGLQQIISKANIPEHDWRFCFIKYPELFDIMSKQYMRIYKGSSILIIKNIATNGYNIEVFTYTLNLILLSKNKSCTYFYELGSYGDHYLTTQSNGMNINIRFKQNRFVIYDASLDIDESGAIIYQTQGMPLSEIISYLENNP